MTKTPPQTDIARAGSPFAIGIFRAVWLASLVSNFGALIQSVGAAWMMTSLTNSRQLIALVQSSTSLPIMLLSLWAGAIADNLDRRRVMIAAQCFRLAVSVLLTIGAFTHLLSPGLLLLFTFLVGCGTAVNSPAWQASVGDMVPRPALPAAVAMNSMGFNLARSTGPAIGGVIVAAGGAASAFLANVLSHFGLIAVLLRWTPDTPPRTLPRERLGAAMMAGLRYVAMSPGLTRIMTRAGCFGFGVSAVPALMPLIARNVVDGGPLTYGIMLAGFGAGAVGGGLSISWLRMRLSSERIARLTTFAAGAAAALTGAGGSLPVSVVMLAIGGAAWLIAVSIFNATVQMSVPRWVVGRAIALYQMSLFGAMAAGSCVFGALADAYGSLPALQIAGAIQIAGLLVAFLLPLRDSGHLDLGQHHRWREPANLVSLAPRSGPIVIMTEHRVAEADQVPFLAAMHERRRIRRRDGARGWVLLRDLADPELWVERYRVATWIDYVRVNDRHTHADVANSEVLKSLRISGSAPVVRRLVERQTSLPPERQTSRIQEALSDPTRAN